MGIPRDAYTIPWDKKKAKAILSGEKYFGEDSINITNLKKFNILLNSLLVIHQEHHLVCQTFLDFKYEKLQELSKTVKSPYLADLERRVNPYK